MNDENDVKALEDIVRAMASAQTGDAITQAWHHDAVWYDLQFLEEKGLENCREVFRRQFDLIRNVTTDLLDIRVFVDGDVGFVHSIQHFECEDCHGRKASDIVTRQTDCFVKNAGAWKLIHQHVSLPLDFKTGKAILKSHYPEK